MVRPGPPRAEVSPLAPPARRRTAAAATRTSHPARLPAPWPPPACLQVLKRPVEGTISRAADAKVAVFAQGVDTTSTETKAREWGVGARRLPPPPCVRRRCRAAHPPGPLLQGTVLIRSAEELEGYSKGEEAKIEEIVKGIADAGVKVVFAGQVRAAGGRRAASATAAGAPRPPRTKGRPSSARLRIQCRGSACACVRPGAPHRTAIWAGGCCASSREAPPHPLH